MQQPVYYDQPMMQQPAMAPVMQPVMQPAMQQVVTTAVIPAKAEWKHGIFNCFDDFALCIGTWCCPFITYGTAGEGMGQNFYVEGIAFLVVVQIIGVLLSFSYTFLVFDSLFIGFVMWQRYEMVEKFGINEECCNTCLLAYFCTFCALQQQGVEGKSRIPQIQAVQAVQAVQVAQPIQTVQAVQIV